MEQPAEMAEAEMHRADEQALTGVDSSADEHPRAVAARKEVGTVPTRIRVVVRVRPQLAIEKSHACTIVRVDPQRNLVQCNSTTLAKSFQFDQVFEGSTPQHTFYEYLKVERMLSAVLDGYHATIFAYGQTGSGKTFTMEGYDYEKPRSHGGYSADSSAPQARFIDGNKDRIGLIPRVIFNLFDCVVHATRTTSREFVIKCSFLQIYNEQILDLLNPAHFVQPRSKAAAKLPPTKSRQHPTQGLRLRWSALRDFYVENLRAIECSSPEQVLQHFQDGIRHKIMASHNLNAASSRSHCIFTLYVESSDPTNAPNDVMHSKLALVDLAGSERVDKTGATGVTLQESIGINKSLFVLRQVIQALSDESNSGSKEGNNATGGHGHLHSRGAYIPYRDSKLTSLLKYSLGGNSWTLMIACLSPSDSYVDENLSTLLYAARAQSIANTPTRNEDPKSILIQELKQEIESLRRQLAQAQDIILEFQQQPGDGNEVANMTALEATGARQDPTESTMTTANDNSIAPALKPTPLVKTTQSDSKTTASLKMNVISNVEMIKQLYTTEKELTDRVTKQSDHIHRLQHESRVLQVENQSLREKIEVLEYLVATQRSGDGNQEGEGMGDDEEDITEIPGYGAMTMSSSGSLTTVAPPSADRIRRVMRQDSNNNMDTTKEIADPQEVHGPVRPAPRKQQDPACNQGSTTTPLSRQRARTNKSTRKEGNAGLLSLSELRDLLGGKQLANGAPSRTPEQRTSSSRPPRSRQRSAQRAVASSVGEQSIDHAHGLPTALRSQAPESGADTTASILSTLQQQQRQSRSNSSSSILEQDPLEALSELNRLLRVKATLRRSSSSRG